MCNPSFAKLARFASSRDFTALRRTARRAIVRIISSFARDHQQARAMRWIAARLQPRCESRRTVDGFAHDRHCLAPRASSRVDTQQAGHAQNVRQSFSCFPFAPKVTHFRAS
jgi:hypothetical protein